jgi:putative flavoprotein involved in K+ transport
VLFDGAPSPGHAWRSRYESLRLFTPAQYCSLPDAPFPAAQDTYPSKDAVANYLDHYAHQFRLDIRAGQRVDRISQAGEGFVLTLSGGAQVKANCVAITGGAFLRPHTPLFASSVPASVQQLHSSQYRAPDQIMGRRVLVVGAGNSGAQIAEELSATRQVALSFERLPKQLPQRFLGRDIFWWLIRAGVLDRATREGRSANETVGQIPLIGSRIKTALSSGQIKRRQRAVSANEGGIFYSDGGSEMPETVIWATGFRPSFELFDFDVRNAAGQLNQTRGISRVPGLFFIGVPGQHTKGSAFLGFVGRDAAPLSTSIAAYLRQAEAAAPSQREGAAPCVV